MSDATITVKDLKNILKNYDDNTKIELALAVGNTFSTSTLLIGNNEILNAVLTNSQQDAA